MGSSSTAKYHIYVFENEHDIFKLRFVPTSVLIFPTLFQISWKYEQSIIEAFQNLADYRVSEGNHLNIPRPLFVATNYGRNITGRIEKIQIPS